jgi:hypothetical protein
MFKQPCGEAREAKTCQQREGVITGAAPVSQLDLLMTSHEAP